MDKKNKTYNFKALKNDLPDHSAPDSIWEGISESLDADSVLDFSEFKDDLPEHNPPENIWEKISEDLDVPVPQYVFGEIKADLPIHTPPEHIWDKISQDLEVPSKTYVFEDLKRDLPQHTPSEEIWEKIDQDLSLPPSEFSFAEQKDKLSTHSPKSFIWDKISEELDYPAPVYSFPEVKRDLPSYSPGSSVWDKIENDLEIKGRIDQLPTHKPKELVWENLEGELDEAKVGVRKLRLAMAMAASFLVLVFSVQFMQCEQEQAPEIMMMAGVDTLKSDWSDDDEDMQLIKEMCKDYMAVCEQPDFKKLENELGELNAHKEELLNMVSEFDEESSYGPMLAKIETQKTELMKQMIEMI